MLRFWVAPQKVGILFVSIYCCISFPNGQMQFVKEFLNVIDLLAIAPFVFELVLVFVGLLII
jgi:hypothetical protein